MLNYPHAQQLEQTSQLIFHILLIKVEPGELLPVLQLSFLTKGVIALDAPRKQLAALQLCLHLVKPAS